MTNTFAIDIIQSLTEEESLAFKDFIDSPYFNKTPFSEIIPIFFEMLKEAIDHKKIQFLSKEEIFQKIYPEKKYIESTIDKLMSETKRLLERFLLTQRYFSPENQPKQILDLSVEMRLRGIENRYHQTLEKANKYKENNFLDALDELFHKYLLAEEEQEWQISYHKSKSDFHIPQTIQALESFYFARKTWMLNQWMLVEKGNIIDASLMHKFSDWDIPQSALNENPFVEICWDIHWLFKNQRFEIEAFQKLLGKIQLSEPKLSPKSLSLLYAYLRNLCVLLIDAGDVTIYPALFKINEDNLVRGYFYKTSKISPNAYLNITQVAINAGEISWAKDFIEQHKDKIIDENETQDFYRMNKALCLFGEKKFDEALEMIPFGSSYSFYHLMARRLELKIYYELRSDLLEHKIDAFKMFISRAGRKVFSENLHELFTNFVNFIRQLHQSDGPKAQQRSQVLINRIKEKKFVAERLWLMEKARELGKKR